jgi:hypothetical protein
MIIPTHREDKETGTGALPHGPEKAGGVGAKGGAATAT